MDKALTDSCIQSSILLPKQKQKINHSSSKEIKKQTMRMNITMKGTKLSILHCDLKGRCPLLHYTFLEGRDHDSCTSASLWHSAQCLPQKQLFSKYLLSGEELNHSLSLKNSISQLWLLYLEINLASSNISTKPVCKNCLSISTYSI